MRPLKIGYSLIPFLYTKAKTPLFELSRSQTLQATQVFGMCLLFFPGVGGAFWSVAPRHPHISAHHKKKNLNTCLHTIQILIAQLEVLGELVEGSALDIDSYKLYVL